MKTKSEILHYQIDTTDAHASVTPLFQCSAFTADSPYFYSRKNNPNVVEFEQIVLKLEKAKFAIAVTTGMSALYMVLDLLKPNDHLLINKHIYGCSYKLFQKVCHHRNIRLSVLDLSEESGIKAIPPDIKMVIFETPTNPFLRAIDIKKVSEKVKSHDPDALVIVDNTWATSLYQHPITLGADISLHSCTKYFSGHSDVMGGVILTNKTDLNEKLLSNRFYAGTILTPYSAWLLRRSLQTLYLRLNHQNNVTKEMIHFLKSLPEISKVYSPTIDGVQLTGYGGILFFELRKDLASYYKLFRESLTLFKTGTGMACVTSMVAQPFTGSHASMTTGEKSEMGLDESLVRLCFGLEDIEDLKQDIVNAFHKVTKVLSK